MQHIYRGQKISCQLYIYLGIVQSGVLKVLICTAADHMVDILWRRIPHLHFLVRRLGTPHSFGVYYCTFNRNIGLASIIPGESKPAGREYRRSKEKLVTNA